MKIIKNIWQIGVIFLLAGCGTLTVQPTVQQPTAVVSNATPLVMYVTATPEFQNVIYITATPDNLNLTATPASTEIAPTATTAASNASITLTKIDDQGGGRAIIEWTMEGNFPSGYAIVWSQTNQTPTYPADQYIVAGDPASRSALVTVNMNKIYYLRVCRLVGGSCDVYSNLGIFALAKVGVTPYVSSGNGQPIPQSTAYNSDGSVINSSTSITITSVVDGGTGKARINWTGTGDFSNGFKILYSTSSATPFVGGYPYYVISSSSTRSAYVDGASGTKYYFRICRTTGTTCDIYSNSYAYTFSGSVVTSTSTPVVTKTSTPVATSTTIPAVTSTSTPVVTSTSTSTPTITATIDPLVTPSSTPTPTETFTPTVTATPDASTINITSVTDVSSGNASVSWSPTGSFPEGYKVLMSATNNPPLSSDVAVIVANEATHTAPITGTPGTTYHITVCKIVGSTCTVQSDPTEFIFGQINLTGFVDSSSGAATISWTASGTFANGFKVLYSSSNANPTLSDTVVNAPTESAVNASVTGTAGTTYHFRVCKYNGAGACVLYSPVVDYTFALITLKVSSPSEGKMDLEWTAVGNFPNGFLGLLSLTTAEPVIGDADTIYGELEGGSSARSELGDTIVAGVSYYIRICQEISSDECGIYSNVVAYDFPSTLVINGSVNADTGEVSLSWTGPTGYSDFTKFEIYRALIPGDPELIQTQDKSITTFSDTVSASGNYNYFVCAYDSSRLRGISNIKTLTVTLP